MSTSLLLALLETHEPNEPDLTVDYYNWIGARWNGRGWDEEGADKNKIEVIMRRLYDILSSYTNTNTKYTSPTQQRPQGKLGTVLARTLTGENGDLQENARVLRAEMRARLRASLADLFNNTGSA